MKKTVIVFIILLGIGAAGFLRGWAQLSVPAGSVGILRSKSHGVHPRVIRGGEFDWVWYKLIPGNASIAVFDIAPQTFHLVFEGELPQAELLATLIGLRGGFDWESSADITFSLRPEFLPSLAEANGIDGEAALKTYLSRLSEEMKAYATSRVLHYFEHPSSESRRIFEQVGASAEFDELSADLSGAFPMAGGITCRFVMRKIPDFAGWESARALYTAYLERQRAVLHGEVTSQAERKIASQFRFDELARYGELLTKYPVLLQYLELELREAGR